MSDIEKAMTSGIVFKGKANDGPKKEEKVKTKAKKTTYIKGLHGSGLLVAGIEQQVISCKVFFAMYPGIGISGYFARYRSQVSVV